MLWRSPCCFVILLAMELINWQQCKHHQRKIHCSCHNHNAMIRTILIIPISCYSINVFSSLYTMNVRLEAYNVTYQSIARQQLGKHLPLVLHGDNGDSIIIRMLQFVAGQSPNINTSTIIEMFSMYPCRNSRLLLLGNGA
jgi:hypothetical protein